ncbi:hypothetical protein EK904_015028 [Melospiza melodia maxima]|nr:hypothetical protein EK904_015028 [Melospiza melodia maxima]
MVPSCLNTIETMDEEEHDEDADSVEDEAASNERFQIKERIAKKLKIDTSENTKQQLQEEVTKTERKTTSRREAVVIVLKPNGLS